MKEYCKQLSSTPMGNFCCSTGKECFTPFATECNEPEWDYLMKMAENYVEENDESF